MAISGGGVGGGSKYSISKNFSIDDAFEEDVDDVIRVYGSTTERSPLKKTRQQVANAAGAGGATSSNGGAGGGDLPTGGDPYKVQQGNGSGAGIAMPMNIKLKIPDDATSKDSDSLIQEQLTNNSYDPSGVWWKHPKIRDNWKMVSAAFILLCIGTALLLTGLIAIIMPLHGLHALVFFIAGAICFIPGAYHVVYVYLAVKGRRGYDFYHLPLFN